MSGFVSSIRKLAPGIPALLFVGMLLTQGPAAHGLCVGDCGDDGAVTVNDLILGVNIALGLQGPAACSAFQNDAGEVGITELIKGVNNALNGCMPEPTVPPVGTSTPTSAIPSDTMTATATLPPATSTSPPHTETPSLPPSESPTPQATATVTSSPSSTPSNTPIRTIEAQESADYASDLIDMLPMPTLLLPFFETDFGSGDSHDSLFSIYDGVPPDLMANLHFARLNATIGEGPATDTKPCATGGMTERTCTETGDGATKTLALTLEAQQCVSAAANGGFTELSGRIHYESAPSAQNQCDPLSFVPSMFELGDFAVPETPIEAVSRDDLQQETRRVSTLLRGTVSVAGTDTCASAVTITLTGTIVVRIASGQTVEARFDHTQMVLDQITYVANCVPVEYRITLNGPATFALTPSSMPITGGEVVEPAVTIPVEFTDFSILENAIFGTRRMMGEITSGCLGGTAQFLTPVPIAATDGELCPVDGLVNVTTPSGTAMIRYDDGTMAILQDGMQRDFPSCVAPAASTCP